MTTIEAINHLSPDDQDLLRAIVCAEILGGAAIVAGVPISQVDEYVDTIKLVLCKHDEEKMDRMSREAIYFIQSSLPDAHLKLRRFLYGESHESE